MISQFSYWDAPPQLNSIGTVPSQLNAIESSLHRPPQLNNVYGNSNHSNISNSSSTSNNKPNLNHTHTNRTTYSNHTNTHTNRTTYSNHTPHPNHSVSNPPILHPTLSDSTPQRHPNAVSPSFPRIISSLGSAVRGPCRQRRALSSMPVEIYFDAGKKCDYLRTLIDTYFQDKREDRRDNSFEELCKSVRLSQRELPPIYEERLDTLVEEGGQGAVVQGPRNCYQDQVCVIQVRESNRIKTYKVEELRCREQIAMELGVPTIWCPYKEGYTTVVGHCLREVLFHGGVPTKYLRRLLMNNARLLIRALVGFMGQLAVVEDRVINNRLTLDNIYVVEGVWKVGQWSNSTFKERHCIQGSEYMSIKQPILKTMEQWLVQPQYLAPEILQTLLHATAYKQRYTSDVWSLGVALMEILVGRSPWEGCRGDLGRVYERQKTIRSALENKTQFRRMEEIIEKMLAFKEEHRPSYCEIMGLFSKI